MLQFKVGCRTSGCVSPYAVLKGSAPVRGGKEEQKCQVEPKYLAAVFWEKLLCTGKCSTCVQQDGNTQVGTQTNVLGRRIVFCEVS